MKFGFNLLCRLITQHTVSGEPTPPPEEGDNTILAIWTEDIARDWIRVEFQNSIGVTAPDVSQFTVTGKTVEEVVMKSDKVLYLRVNSRFTYGAVISLIYTAADELLGNLGSQEVLISNLISNIPYAFWSSEKANYYVNQSTDFNAAEGITDAGGVFEMDNINFGTMDIGKGTNLIFVAKYGGDTQFTYFNFREAVLHCTLVGHPAMPDKNIKIHNGKAYFGIGCYATGNLRFDDLHIYDVVQGLQVKTVADLLYYPYNLSREDYQALSTKRILIEDTSQEAFYIGSDVASPILINWQGEDLQANDIGYDAFQFRNGTCTLNRISWDGVGLEENTNHAHGFLFGTNTNSGSVSNVTGRNTFGYGMSINGYGTLNITDADVESEMNTVYIRNYDDHDDLGVGGLTVNFLGTNLFDTTRVTADPRSLDVRRDPEKPTTITININATTTFVDTPYVEDGVNGPDNGVIANYP